MSASPAARPAPRRVGRALLRRASHRILGGGPSPEFLFLCRALGPPGPGEGTPDPPFRWDRFLGLAREKGVSSLLARLPGGGRGGPEPLRRALEEDHHRTLAENLLRLAAVERILDALARRGLPVLLLKGVDLLDRLHRDPGARRMIDADLLLRPESCPEADAVLSGCGYRVLLGKRPTATPRVTDGINSAMYADPASGFRIHLHWHIVNETFPASAGTGPSGGWDAERLWRESVPAAVGGARARALSPAHLLVHLAAHGLKHGFGLLHVCEFSRASALFVPAAAGGGEVIGAARAFGQLPALRWMLRASRERFGPVPAAALSGLLPEEPLTLLEGFVLACLRRGRESSALGILARAASREAGSGLLPAVARSRPSVRRAGRACGYLARSAREILCQAP